MNLSLKDLPSWFVELEDSLDLLLKFGLKENGSVRQGQYAKIFDASLFVVAIEYEDENNNDVADIAGFKDEKDLMEYLDENPSRFINFIYCKKTQRYMKLEKTLSVIQVETEEEPQKEEKTESLSVRNPKPESPAKVLGLKTTKD